MSLKNQITEDVKNAMRAKEAGKLATLRLLTAAIKQKEVDERTELDDTQVLGVVDKMIKQRNDSISQFEAGGRQDLADKEKAEVEVLKIYLPAKLSDAEVKAEVERTIGEVGAKEQKDMGRVMAVLKPRLAGKADMTQVSALVKAALTAG